VQFEVVSRESPHSPESGNPSLSGPTPDSRFRGNGGVRDFHSFVLLRVSFFAAREEKQILRVAQEDMSF
jgi:hypothetical protein